MFALVIALLAAVLLLPSSLAQTNPNPYTVLSSVVFIRSGEHTPQILTKKPSALTSLGAQQAYNAGSFLRGRYVTSTTSRSGVERAPLRGLSPTSYDPIQMYILAQDTHPTAATAQAFMQGFYPPMVLNETTAALVDSSSVLANESYVEPPLNGYQYAQIRTADELDPEFIYLAGSSRCPAFRAATVNSTASPEFNEIQSSTKSFYTSVVGDLLNGVIPDAGKDYINAYAIYDYLNYQATHNASAAATLNQAPNPENVTELDRLRFLADAQQFALASNLSARNTLASPADGLPSGVQGSISTIAGNMLLTKILNQLQLAIETRGRYYKLSVLAGDFQPLLSLFAITGLSDLNSDKFRGIPDFASMAVFELFTYTTEDVFAPSANDLWVRFYFRNGTEQHDDQLAFQSYPLFSHGPSETDLRWRDFQAEASTLAMRDVGDWCQACAATSIWCPAFNGSLLAAAASAKEKAASSRNALSPAVSGVLGAIIALIVAALIFALAMVVGSVRLHRKKTLQAGGFHGPAKATPDRDVEVSGGAAKNGAVVSGREASTEPEVGGSVPGGHERIGSWEMKEPATKLPPDSNRMRFSFEDDDDEDYRRAVDPFADPVKPKEI